MAQTTQNLPETDPTIQIPYLEEVEITKEKFDSEQRRKNVELNGYLEQQSNSDFQSTKYDMVNSGKSHRQNSNSFMFFSENHKVGCRILREEHFYTPCGLDNI